MKIDFLNYCILLLFFSQNGDMLRKQNGVLFIWAVYFSE